MPEKTELKVPKTYSLDPVLIAWVSQKAARQAIESNGQRPANDSKVVNDILRAAMEKDIEEIEDSPTSTKRKTNPSIRAARADAVPA
jgi:hypothetical protein